MPLETTRSKIDATVSALVGSFIAINIMLGSGAILFASHQPDSPWQKVPGVLLIIWCVLTESWFLGMTWRTLLRRERPFAVALALQQPQLSLPLRPIASLWWLFQFLMAVGWGIVLSVYEKNLPYWAWGVVVISISGIAYLTFGYLLLAITAFTRRTAVIAKVWRWRGRWAISHGLIVLAAKTLIAPFVDLR